MGAKSVQPRTVAVAIPYSTALDGKVRICLVTSRKHDQTFVLPKGGIEKGETGRVAAIREMWEEAGLRPIESTVFIDSSTMHGSEGKTSSTILSSVADHKPHKHSPSADPSRPDFVPRAVYEAHEVAVSQGDPTSECSQWPEMQERERKWVDLQEALDLIAWRKDIHHLLLRSSLVKKVEANR